MRVGDARTIIVNVNWVEAGSDEMDAIGTPLEPENGCAPAKRTHNRKVLLAAIGVLAIATLLLGGAAWWFGWFRSTPLTLWSPERQSETVDDLIAAMKAGDAYALRVLFFADSSRELPPPVFEKIQEEIAAVGTDALPFLFGVGLGEIRAESTQRALALIRRIANNDPDTAQFWQTVPDFGSGRFPRSRDQDTSFGRALLNYPIEARAVQNNPLKVKPEFEPSPEEIAGRERKRAVWRKLLEHPNPALPVLMLSMRYEYDLLSLTKLDNAELQQLDKLNMRAARFLIIRIARLDLVNEPGNQKLLAILEKYLGHADSQVRQAAALTIVEHFYFQSVQWPKRSGPASAVIRHGGPKLVVGLTEALSHPNPLQRAAAAVGLAILGQDAASSLPSLRIALSDRDRRVRETVHEALKVVGKPK